MIARRLVPGYDADRGRHRALPPRRAVGGVSSWVAARVVELADTMDSSPIVRKDVRVRLPPRAPQQAPGTGASDPGCGATGVVDGVGLGAGDAAVVGVDSPVNARPSTKSTVPAGTLLSTMRRTPGS